MTTAVCTLFEKDYHHGVAALSNSLVCSGFRGRIYAGYRGSLPDWLRAGESMECRWPGATRREIAPLVDLVLLPLQTQAHFTNIKPDFMLELFAEPDFGIDRLFYLDPDICVMEQWQFFEEWVRCGVAVCEDINSPLAENHPRRIGWRQHFGQCGQELSFRMTEYANGGCVGVGRGDIRFLEMWRLLSRHMADIVGGLEASILEGGQRLAQSGFAGCFDRSDQDALNATIEATDASISMLSRTAMGFLSGSPVLPHALGRQKPWRRRYLVEAMNARVPTAADKAFWNNVDGPLRSMSEARKFAARLDLAFASFVGRWYRRSA